LRGVRQIEMTRLDMIPAEYENATQKMKNIENKPPKPQNEDESNTDNDDDDDDDDLVDTTNCYGRFLNTLKMTSSNLLSKVIGIFSLSMIF
jgi:hypothetical protein